MIELKNICKSFGDKQLFKNLSLTVQTGEKIAIIGPSGCGKSTILQYLLGLSFPDQGKVMVNQQLISSLTKDQLSEQRLNMGMLFQSAALFDSLSVKENIAFPLIENYGFTLNSAMKKVQYVLELVGLSEFEDNMPYQLSGGQQKRVGLARAIVTEPKYIFYDEPTTGLDPVMSTNIENVMVRLNEVMNITSIVVSHQKSTILRTTDKIYMVNDGTLLAPETPKTIEKSSNEIIRSFMKGNQLNVK